MTRHTKREDDVGKYLLQGLGNKEIADRMGIQERTVKSYLHQMYIKHGISEVNRIKRIVLAVKLYEERRGK